MLGRGLYYRTAFMVLAGTGGIFNAGCRDVDRQAVVHTESTSEEVPENPPSGAPIAVMTGESTTAQYSEQEAIEAVENGNLDSLRKMIDAGLDVDSRDSAGNQTLLHVAAWKQNHDLARFLIERGAQVDARNRAGGTPLHAAHWNGGQEVARLLLGAGADINAVDQTGWTVLHWASYNGQAEMVEFLVRSGASVNTRGRNGQTPVSSAQARGHRDVVDILNARAITPSRARQRGTGRASSRAPGTAAAARQEAITWFSSNSRFKSDSSPVRQFTDQLDQAIREDSCAVWLLGSGMTSLGVPYQLEWSRTRFRAVPLDIREAAQSNLDPKAVRAFLLPGDAGCRQIGR